ncbi:aminotransferase class IV [Tenacibaculum geojense]|uniref:branched-chain-amino-acid transaminase n=1 Tax=Tenacibaculum geojense TaxID=915352 RepID=A0ABW3JNH4_9FLAO
MINYNGTLYSESDLQLSHANRAFKYGDGIFETIKIQHNKVVFWEDHYFRLMASMRMLRMKIPMEFTLEFLENEILKTAKHIDANFIRVRLNVFRKDGGLYTPLTNEVDYLLEAAEITSVPKQVYKVDLYKDFYNYSGLLSTVKTTNRMLNTLAGVFAKENDFDNCVLLNEHKNVVEVLNGNIFIIKDNVIKTPPVSDGCIKGIIRKKLIEIIQKHPDYTLEEVSISPFEIQKADEVFITNAIIGIQPVTNYRKKEFSVNVSTKLQNNLKLLQATA